RSSELHQGEHDRRYGGLAWRLSAHAASERGEQLVGTRIGADGGSEESERCGGPDHRPGAERRLHTVADRAATGSLSSSASAAEHGREGHRRWTDRRRSTLLAARVSDLAA